MKGQNWAHMDIFENTWSIKYQSVGCDEVIHDCRSGQNLLHHQLQLYKTTVYSLIIILQLQLYYANDELRLL